MKRKINIDKVLRHLEDFKEHPFLNKWSKIKIIDECINIINDYIIINGRIKPPHEQKGKIFEPDHFQGNGEEFHEWCDKYEPRNTKRMAGIQILD